MWYTLKEYAQWIQLSGPSGDIYNPVIKIIIHHHHQSYVLTATNLICLVKRFKMHSN